MAIAEIETGSERRGLIYCNESAPSPAQTLFDLIRYFAIATPNNTALVDYSCKRMVSYAELASGIEVLAGKLASIGVREGSDVVVLMPRCANLVLIVLAISRVGGRCLPYMSARDINQALQTARRSLTPTVFLHSQEIEAERLATPGEEWVEFETLDATSHVAPVKFIPTADTVAYCNETSGSTSNPKIVPATHRALLTNTAACVQTFGITAADVHLCTFASHVHEVFARAFFTGGSAVLVHESVADHPLVFLDAMVRHSVTCLMSNSTTYSALVSLSNFPRNRFSLRLAESGGIPTPETLKHHVRAKFGAALTPVWGSTESTGVAIAPQQGEETPVGSVGKAIDGYTVEIINAEGLRLPAGQSGELIVYGPGVASGYLSHQGASDLSLGFRTGDRAKIDKDGWVFIRGRIGNEFKVAGLIVSAEQIETAIMNSKHVAKVAVLPELHPVLGYSAVAIVVPADQSALVRRKDEQRVIGEIIKEAEKHLRNPFLELPTSIKWISGDLPRTPAGKVDRRGLLKLYRDYPPSATKVRLPRLKKLRIAIQALDRKSVRSLLLSHPIRFARLVLKVLKGTKAK